MDSRDIKLTEERRVDSHEFGMNQSSYDSKKHVTIRRSVCYVLVGLVIVAVVIAAVAAHYGTKNNLSSSSNSDEEITSTPKTTTETPMSTTTKKPIPENSRLPLDHTPHLYDVWLKPYIYPGHYEDEMDLYTFKGRVTIHFTANKVTKNVVMHSHTLSIDESSIELKPAGGGDAIGLHHLEFDTDRQFLKLMFHEDLAADANYTLHMRYNGTHLHKDLDGFYLSNYTENEVKKHLVVTQFQTTHARQAFPCFDEPSFKARFHSTLVRHKNFTSISNTEIINSKVDGDFVEDEYSHTPIMSTYLNAYVVSEFTRVTCTNQSDGTTFYHWARPAYAKYLNYSCDVTPNILQTLVDYTNFPHQVKHTDQIAVPDFSAGAMENWGLITYRETLLCQDDKFSTVIDHLRIAGVIAHELAHMWFGNLVTCAWWDDTFLNEAFASYFEWPPLEDLYKDTWQTEQRFVRDNLAVMRTDDNYKKTQSIYVPGIEHHTELTKAFSSITYSKGAAVLRMFNKLLGSNVFRDALRKYLIKYQFSNTKHADLWEAIQEHLESTNDFPWPNEGSLEFSDYGNSWVEQKGHPLLGFSKEQPANEYSIAQHIFNINNTEEVNSTSKWFIKLLYAKLADLPTGNFQYQWMYKNESITASLTLEDMLNMNIDGQAFLRIDFDDDSWTHIIETLMEESTHDNIRTLQRAHLVDDAFRLARAGYRKETLGLELSRHLVYETQYVPVFSLLDPGYGGLIYIDRMLRSRPVYPKFIEYMQSILKKPFQRIDFTFTPKANLSSMLFNDLITDAACYFHLPECVYVMTTKFVTWRQNTDPKDKDPTIMNADLRKHMYCQGVTNGYYKDVAEYLDYVNRTRDEVWYAYEPGRLLDALACTSQTWRIEQQLEQVRLNGAVEEERLTAMLSTEIGRQTVLKFLQKHYAEMPCGRTAALRSIGAWFKTEDDIKEMEAFIDLIPKVNNTCDPNDKEVIEDIIENIRENIEWLEKNEEEITNWLDCALKPGNTICWDPTSTRSSTTSVYDSHLLFGPGQPILNPAHRRV